jgi:hypothetical protein
MGIEPTSSAWKAEVLPLNYTRIPSRREQQVSWAANEAEPPGCYRQLVEGVGFEPTKALASRFTVCPRWPLGYPSQK